MPRAQLLESWVTGVPADQIWPRLETFFAVHNIKKVDSGEGYMLGVQGSQLKFRMLGAWLAKPADFPKKMSVAFERTETGLMVHANIEEDMGPGVMVEKTKTIYMRYFQDWMNALKATLP